MIWKTASRTLDLARPLVMGILNVTPDSFSDGGRYDSVAAALAHAEQMIADGADMIDIGGESTRPGSTQVCADLEIERVIPVIEHLSRRVDVAISIDTTKAAVAEAAIAAGAEIINDISGLRWDPAVADVSARTGAALILMHSRGTFESMHSQERVRDIVSEVTAGLKGSINTAKQHGVSDDRIAIDVGIGFSKSFEQNLELLAKLDEIANIFTPYPMIVGTSRKSFIGRVLGDLPVDQRVSGSVASAVMAAQKGARIIRVHDVKETVNALAILEAVERPAL